MKLHRDMFLSDRDMLDCDEVPPVRTFNATSGKKICALLSLSQASNVSHQHTESAAPGECGARDIFCDAAIPSDVQDNDVSDSPLSG